MDAVDFLKGYVRMCNTYRENMCKNCPLDSFLCELWQSKSNDDEINIIKKVEEWVNTHPVKTRQSEFLRLFPNALNGSSTKDYLDLCPLLMTGGEPPKCSQDCDAWCPDCCRKFWLEEI